MISMVLFSVVKILRKWYDVEDIAFVYQRVGDGIDKEGCSMNFRPCIDIHNGKVKQIVGGSLLDAGNQAEENFVAGQDAAFYADMYRNSGISGGHIILLNKEGTEYYDADVEQAGLALAAYPQGLMIGGGIHAGNAETFIDMGASHVIVTSYVFVGGHVHYDRLKSMGKAVGRERLVLDLSCRKRDGQYYIVTDRWQRFTDEPVTLATLDRLSAYCDEFLIHAVDVEGRVSGIERELAALLGQFDKIPVTYAGGVSSFEDLHALKELGRNHVDVTIGSALDLFGGHMDYEEVIRYCKGEV